MILTVTPNPAIDLTYRVSALETGETHRVAPPAVRAGGKGLNVARVLQQTGAASFVLTTAGGASGVRLADDLETSGVPNELVTVQAPTRSSIAIVDERGGETTVLNETGGALSAAEWTALNDAAARLALPATCVVGSGSLPPDTPDAFYAGLVAIASERGLPSVMDATGPALLLAAEARPTVLKPNRRELAETTGEADPVTGASVLLNAGAALVLVSLGADGMLAVRRGADVLHARLDRRLTGNATGAGDAAVAAVASCLADGTDDPAVLLCRAVAWSAAAVVAPLAGELDPAYAAYEERVVLD
ncbi:1-phosphofructokinase family hexose kinase [Leifsonia sp. F6_8S_P_1B]|uniref:1-phosphofructokinase family hexose kinase n=1 Tax=Leifsonia williamsii TaxID=3035919 RepID=A0ABT8KF74_9MICO|nr:1-phosphofructokinase family hexose kinase [Leifsonia williamsii]MDN4616101.1 1-phosphofructokinase family hexose kinase [Leifsonia williamsii]